MRLLPLLLAAAALLSGCVHVESTTRTVNGETRSMECQADACKVCVEGQCVPCERAECEACLDGGECPDADGDKPAAPLDDVAVQRTYDLSMGLPAETVRFQVAPGATGHIAFRLHDLVTHETTVDGAVCVRHTITDGGSVANGSSGTCTTGLSVSVEAGTVSTDETTILDWDASKPGDYKMTFDAGPQPNELVVDIAVDNPGN